MGREKRLSSHIYFSTILTVALNNTYKKQLFYYNLFLLNSSEIVRFFPNNSEELLNFSIFLQKNRVI